MARSRRGREPGCDHQGPQRYDKPARHPCSCTGPPQHGGILCACAPGDQRRLSPHSCTASPGPLHTNSPEFVCGWRPATR